MYAVHDDDEEFDRSALDTLSRDQLTSALITLLKKPAKQSAIQTRMEEDDETIDLGESKAKIKWDAFIQVLKEWVPSMPDELTQTDSQSRRVQRMAEDTFVPPARLPIHGGILSALSKGEDQIASASTSSSAKRSRGEKSFKPGSLMAAEWTFRDRFWSPADCKDARVKTQEDEEKMKFLKPTIMDNLPSTSLTNDDLLKLELDLRHAAALLSLNRWIHDACCNIAAYMLSDEDTEDTSPERAMECLQILLLHQKDFFPVLEDRITTWLMNSVLMRRDKQLQNLSKDFFAGTIQKLRASSFTAPKLFQVDDELIDRERKRVESATWLSLAAQAQAKSSSHSRSSRSLPRTWSYRGRSAPESKPGSPARSHGSSSSSHSQRESHSSRYRRGSRSQTQTQAQPQQNQPTAQSQDTSQPRSSSWKGKGRGKGRK